MDLGVWMSLGLGLRIWIPGFGSQDSDLWVWVSGCGSLH